jgi:hypothetical protein
MPKSAFRFTAAAQHPDQYSGLGKLCSELPVNGSILPGPLAASMPAW